MKNHHLDLIRVTEAGAIAAASWVGRGNKEAADKCAADAMRERFNQIDFCAEVAIGEGIKDNVEGLYQGDIVGAIHGEPTYNIAIDPIEGTRPVSQGGPEAMSVVALAGRNCFFKTDAFYMNKLAVGPHVYKASLHLGLKWSLKENVYAVALVLNKQVKHITVCVMDRPRHDNIVKELRELGCRIKFITDCDVTACIATCVPGSGIDMYVGVGGAPEAVIAAAAVKCMGGLFEAQISDKTGQSFEEHIYSIEELACGDVMFAATGITDGQLLKGVQFTNKGAVTHSISMRSESGTIRRLITEHGN